MKLIWQKTLNTIVVSFTNGDQFECSAALWTRVSNAIDDDIFKTINKYWSMLPIFKVEEFENKYRQIQQCFQGSTDPHILNHALKPLVCDLVEMFEWDKFKLWCRLHGDLFLLNGIKDTLDDKDRIGLTYYTADYEDLMVFSVIIKSIMPIWGAYHDELTESIGKYYIHMAAIELMRSPSISRLPPLLKLESYIDCFTEIKIKKAGFSLLSGIGTEEIPAFLLSLAILKKVVIYNVQDPDGSIVKNVYHLLTERCNEITKVKPNEKRDIDKEGSDLTIADRYKIVQRIPPAVSVAVEVYCESIETMALHIDATVPLSLIEKYARTVDNSLQICEFHLPILGAVTNGVITGRTLEIIHYEYLLNVIVASAAVLEHWGFLEIAELITTKPQEKDYYKITSSLTGNRSYSQLRPDVLSELNYLYPYISNNKNPGIAIIDVIIKELIRYEWNVKSENFNDIRNSIALLLIKQLGGVK